jgi:hypothetical protein
MHLMMVKLNVYVTSMHSLLIYSSEMAYLQIQKKKPPIHQTPK